MITGRILFKIYRFVGIPLRLLLAFLIAFSSFPFNIQGVSADAGSTRAMCEEDPSLVGCWRMEEGSGTLLQDGGVTPFNEGAIVGTPSWVTGARDISALEFDGLTNYVTVADDNSLDITSSITMAAWIKTTVTVNTAQSIINKSNGTSGYELSLSNDGKIITRFFSPDGSAYQVDSTSDYPLTGSWIHVAATYDGSTIRIYTNGEEDSSGNGSFSIGTNDLALGFGSQSDGGTKFKGAIDDVRIYNRALTADDIQGLAGITPSDSSATSLPSFSVTALDIFPTALPTVTFEPNGGTGTMDPQSADTPTALTTNSFSRTGYTFAGWNTVAGGTGTAYADGAEYPFIADITLYAQWTALPNRTATFNSNGGTGTMAPQVTNIPTALTTNSFSRTGYTFAGWNTVAVGGGTAYADGAEYAFDANITLYAQWTALPNFTVTFNANNGTGTMTPQVANVPTALTTNSFSRTGYTFAGWNTVAVGGGTAYADGAEYAFDANITLYAQWTALPNFTVTFNANNGTGTMTPQVANVPTALTTNSFSRTGYTFAGWNTVAVGGGTAYADGAEYAFDANITLYAQWTALPNFTVTFNANNGTGTMTPQVANVPTALTTNSFSRTGYTFAGWNTVAVGGGTAYADGAEYAFDANITLYAQWTALPNFTVTFNANNGTGTMTPQVANVPTALTTNSFSRTGYTFAGWNTVAVGGGTAYADGAEYAFDANITLYAQWTALPNFTVTFNANNGTGTMTPQVANVPTALTTNSFSRLGYTFNGWNTVAVGGGTAYADGAEYAFDANITLYAQWTALPNRTVTFNANGGTGSMAQQIANVPAALTTNAFTRLGYTFQRWDTQPDGLGTPYANGAIYNFAADIMLYAQWTSTSSHTVTFNANGGTGTMAQQIANVPAALTANAFTRLGYTFQRWDTQPDGLGTPYANSAVYAFAVDVTLYAQWTALPSHTVTFHANGGTGTMAEQVANVPTALTANAFTYPGNTFTGWNSAANGSGDAYANSAVYAFDLDVTLYAQWTPLPSHTVTFHANGGTGTMAPQVANMPTALTANAFTYLGFSFNGWNSAANGSGIPYANSAVYAFAVDVTLYAQWNVNVAPVITQGASVGVTMSEDGAPIAFVLTLDATDEDLGDTLTWSISSPASHGLATALGTGASKGIGYTPTTNYNGSDSFVVQVSDGNGGTDTITVNVTINPVNDPPVITGQVPLKTPKNTALTITLADLTVTDVDNSYPTGFTLTVQAGTNYTFVGNTITPATNYTGTLTVPVRVSDGTANSNTFNLSVTVTRSPLTYYVNNTNPSCSDVGAGTTPALPFCKISVGTSKAIVGGDILRVLAGTYAETVKPSSGIAGNPITVSAAPGVTVTGDAGNSTNGGGFRLFGKSYIVIDGFTITSTADYGIYTYGSDHITITNNHVSYSGNLALSIYREGIYINSTTYSLIDGNVSDHNSNDGIRLISGANNNVVSNNISAGNAQQTDTRAMGINVWASNYNTIINNITYANEDSGLNFYTGSSYNKVIGNLTYGNGDHGIDNNNAPNNVFIGNTVHGNVTAGINLEGTVSPGSSGATLINNISTDNGLLRQDDGSTSTGAKSNIRVDSLSIAGTTLDYNLVYQSTGTGIVQFVWGSAEITSLAAFRTASGQETHGILADPLFTAPAPIAERPHTAPYGVAINVGDYHLTAGSPAIDSANSNAPNQPTLDIDGNARVDDPLVTNTGAGTRTYDDRGAYEYQPTITYTVTFDANGGSGLMSNQAANVPTALTLNTFTWAGYSFSGWNTVAGGGGTAYADGATYPFNANITLYAQWTVLPNFTVTFNANNGTGTMAPQVTNIPTALTLNSFTRAGYTFNGWNTVAVGGGTAYADGALYAFDANITLYAQWTALPNFTVTFNANNGTGTMAPQATNIPTALTLNSFTRAGYAFNGWNTVAVGGGIAYADGAVYAFDANITLYAQWTALPNRTATFNSNGGTGTMAPQVTNIPTALTLNSFTRLGYNFNGWNTVAGGTGTAYADGAEYPFIADITLYAQWTTLPTYTLTAGNDGHGTVTLVPTGGTYVSGTTVHLIPVASVGYVFSSWTGANSGDIINNAGEYSIVMNSNKTVTANFTVSTLLSVSKTGTGSGTVTSSPAGIDCGATCLLVFDYNTVVTLTAAASAGSIFTGWSGAGCSGTGTCQVTMTAAASVTANFNPFVSTWFLAEGFTGANFGTYILIQNPNVNDANVQITYMLEGGGTEIRYVTVAGNSRYTVVTQDAGQVGIDKAFSTKLRADKQIIVERAMYWPNGEGTTGGHATTGIRQPVKTWYLAEGYTGNGFNTFILIQNPNDVATVVNVTYMIQGGTVVNKTLTVPANSRFTIAAHDPAQVGPDKAFSTKLVANLPIVVERAMYFNNDGHASGGVASPELTWYLAEGFTGAGFGTYILIQNPGTVVANINVTYMIQGGGTITRNLSVSPNSRETIVAQEIGQVGPDQAFSTKLVSDQPIIVERAMYSPNGLGSRGHDVAAVYQAEHLLVPGRRVYRRRL